MPINKVLLLGSSSALKPCIILQTLVENAHFNYMYWILTDSEDGILVDYCRDKNICYSILPKNPMDGDETLKMLKELDADILISCGWPKKIPSKVLSLFHYKPINCHGSYLPDYKGSRAYMHYWANINDFYGASIHYMNDSFDDGNIILRGKLKLFLEETPQIIHQRTAELCGYLLANALILVENGFEGYKVEDEPSRYFYKLSFDEFEEYRNYNLNSKIKKLTPYKEK